MFKTLNLSYICLPKLQNWHARTYIKCSEILLSIFYQSITYYVISTLNKKSYVKRDNNHNRTKICLDFFLFWETVIIIMLVRMTFDDVWLMVNIFKAVNMRDCIIAAQYPVPGASVDLIRLLVDNYCSTLVSIHPLSDIPSVTFVYKSVLFYTKWQ